MAVIVFTESWDAKFKKSSFELVSYAKAIANSLGSKTIAISIASVAKEELNKLGIYGADKIISVPNEAFKTLDNLVYTKLIAEIAEKEDARILVLAHNNTGKALAPRLSVRLKAGLVSAAVKLPSSYNPFKVYKKVFSGKGFVHQIVNTEKQVLTLSNNSFELIESNTTPEIEEYSPEVSAAEISTTVVDIQKQTGKLILTDAEIVVSGGRGMKSPDNWGAIEELAELLGAATACSRPVSDEGWRPHSEHTGQTGKIIAPNLYIAAGISGAIQHLAGVSSSKCIVAINTDKDAPIFEAADYGIVGDAAKVLPELIEAVKEI
ncbi:MAG: electron transfer flavoprotein subunit alpha/FixB family protein [Bacteroidota bacterium]|nr:electron transfer flavoprotein subunit alpha/FixB family protein [Bacteroidota bacterium]